MLPAMTIIPLVSRMTFPLSRRPGSGGLMDLFRVMISMRPTAEPPPSQAAGPGNPASLITVTRNDEALNARPGTPFPANGFCEIGAPVITFCPDTRRACPGLFLFLCWQQRNLAGPRRAAHGGW